MRQVAICGLAEPHWRHAPLGDLAWECWGLAHSGARYKLDRAVESHTWDLWRREPNGVPYAEYMAHLREIRPPQELHVRQFNPALPQAKLMPYDKMMAVVKEAPQSSGGWMMALALYEHVILGRKIDRIGLWGWNMETRNEYGHQRANMRAMVGFARGCGIAVWVCEDSTLMDGDIPYGGADHKTYTWAC